MHIYKLLHVIDGYEVPMIFSAKTLHGAMSIKENTIYHYDSVFMNLFILNEDADDDGYFREWIDITHLTKRKPQEKIIGNTI